MTPLNPSNNNFSIPMKRTFLLGCLIAAAIMASAKGKPWDNGRLTVSDNQQFLMHANGTPFFWLGETAWLMPQRLNRDEVAFYLQTAAEAGYNMVQVQVLNAIPSYNIYGFSSDDEGYWRHMDHIVATAERFGIYIGMVCVWGSQVKNGAMDLARARQYGEFLAKRYKDKKNIVWIMGGDIQGDIHPEVWEALATAIKTTDKNHLMTYHPRGRYTSAHWWSKASWMDFHTFQSGHRRYGQRMGNKEYPIPDNTEEDNWMYVDSTWAYKPLKPVIDDEPIYEDIPKGLHDADEPRWTAADVRRYAYWSVFAGSCGHTYGNNSIMQFYRPGLPPAYYATRPWYEALHDPGFRQMQYLKQLILSFPYFERIPDQAIVKDNGTQYERLAATRGSDYLLVYNFTGRDMQLDLTRISGKQKNVWWLDAATGEMKYLGTFDNKTITFRPHHTGDGVLIAVDTAKNYLKKDQTRLSADGYKEKKDRNE